MLQSLRYLLCLLLGFLILHSTANCKAQRLLCCRLLIWLKTFLCSQHISFHFLDSGLHGRQLYDFSSIAICGCRSLLLLSLSNAVMIFSLVPLITCFLPIHVTLVCCWCRVWEIFLTDHTVNLGHVENCLLLISFSSVCLGRLNPAWWSYLMSSILDVMSYVLYVMCLVWIVCVSGDFLLYECSGNIHNLVCGFIPPLHTSFLL